MYSGHEELLNTLPIDIAPAQDQRQTQKYFQTQRLGDKRLPKYNVQPLYHDIVLESLVDKVVFLKPFLNGQSTM
jgi:hypothetical protein